MLFALSIDELSITISLPQQLKHLIIALSPVCSFHSVHYNYCTMCRYVLTSALRPGVSPVVLLTVCACLPSKAITALTLTGKLPDRKR